MRILCLMTDAFGGRGGIAQYNRDFLNALSGIEKVDKVIVLPRLAADEEFQLPEKIVQLKPVFHPAAYSLRALWISLTRGPFDLIFCGHIRMSLLAGLVSLVMRKPLWLQIHGIEAWAKAGRVETFFIKRAVVILSVSRFSRRKILSWANVDPAQVKVLSNAVDLSRFKPGAKPKKLLEQWGLSNCQVMLTVSRLDASERYKGHSLVIKAMPELLKSHPQLRYVIAGSGGDQLFLKCLAKECGVQNEVIFLGQIQESLKPELYHLADVFVMPSKKEGFGIVFLEAMASGVPVIAGNKDGSVDPLRDGENGRLVNPDDLHELTAAIEEQLSGNEYKRVSATQFSFSNFKNHLSNILKSVSHDTRSA